MGKMKILYLITARKGSKSIKDKNIKFIAGLPLIGYKIKLALSITDDPNDVWVSTDSEVYSKIAKSYGANIPFIRPDSLATDEASSVDVVLHAIDHAEKLFKQYDYLCLLEPTVPFISTGQLKQALLLLSNNPQADGIVAVKEVMPHITFIQEENVFLDEIAQKLSVKGKDIRRQNFKKQITPSGGFYVIKWDVFKSQRTFYTGKTLSYCAPNLNSIEIDEPLDFVFAEFIAERELIKIDNLFSI